MKRMVLTAIIAIMTAGFANASALTDDYIDIAASYVKDGKYSQALGYINKALAVEPQNFQLIEMKNDLLKVMGQNVIVSQRPMTTGNETYLQNAIDCYNKKNFQGAKNNLDTYLSKQPKSDFAFMLRAKTNLNLGEPQSALRDIKSAESIYSNPEYLLTEAIILAEIGKYEQAKKILTKLSENIQTYLVFKYLGICDYKLGDYKNAVMNFDRAIILFEDDKTILPMYNSAKRMNNES
ncbi:MAG: hypothetical protein NC390_04195 [Fusobacterium sp.]|nr:hypothetical protein [Fusobacterium sp.]